MSRGFAKQESIVGRRCNEREMQRTDFTHCSMRISLAMHSIVAKRLR